MGKEMKEILQKEDDLQEIVQLVGKDSLSEDQKCTLEVARVIREDFLQQNGYSEHDYKCPLAKNIGMMRVIVGFHSLSQKAMAEFSGDAKVTWSTISNMKFQKPEQTEEQFKKFFGSLYDEVQTA